VAGSPRERGHAVARVLTSALMKGAPAETDFVVIGAGVAGLPAAIELADAGRVVVLAKREVTDSATQWAQGGIAAALEQPTRL
jgi:aspartate oxidase